MSQNKDTLMHTRPWKFSWRNYAARRKRIQEDALGYKDSKGKIKFSKEFIIILKEQRQ